MIPAKTVDAKGTRILAKSLFRELRENGYTAHQVLALSTELIDLVTQDLKGAAETLSPVNGEEAEEEKARANWRAAI